MTDQPPSEGAAPPPGFYPGPDGAERFWDGTRWTEHTKSPAEPPAAKKKKRVFMWFFLAVQVLFLIWIIAGIAGNSGDATDCGSLTQETCNDAKDVGTALGVGLIIVFWAVVDIILGFIYLVVKLARR